MMHKIILIPLLLTIASCMGPMSLHRSVINYDESVSRIESEILLVNIARTHRNIPTHFTVTSRIAATFDYNSSAGFIATIFEKLPGVNSYSGSLGLSAAENPTLSIIPIQGEEFTKRILSPLDESNFLFLVFQGAPLDMVMRLMARGIEFQNQDGTFERFIINWPTRKEEYIEFRKRTLHLVWLNSNRNLFVSRLQFQKTIHSPKEENMSAMEITKLLNDGYKVEQADGQNGNILKKEVSGRVVMTNYDPQTLTNDEKCALNRLASSKPDNFVLIHVRPDFPGGDYPIFGAVKLRSLNEILEFIAAGIKQTPEIDVPPDPRTKKTVSRNPRSTLNVEIGKIFTHGTTKVRYKGKKYSIANTAWDLEAFKLLYYLFQMSMTDVSGLGIPITITK